MKEIRRCLILLHPVKHSSMFTRIFMILFIYSVTYTANLFGKAFVHVRNCLRKEKHMKKISFERVYAFNYIRNLHAISCLQNTLILYKQTSALHIINPRVLFIYLFIL
jgi:hypothetical protein